MGKLKQEFEEKFCYEMMDLDGKNRHHYITPRVADKPQIIIEWIASKIKGNKNAEVKLIKKFIDDIEIIYNACDWGAMQTECESVSERYYNLLMNKYNLEIK